MSNFSGLELLRRIEEGVAGKSGDAFFRQIVREIAIALHAHVAFTSQLLPNRRAAMKAYWVRDHYEDCLEYSLAGTPCEYVYAGRITAYARDICNIFPVDRDWFTELGANSYLGIPIKNETGEVFGHLAVLDTVERDWHDADLDILHLFSLRTAVELERSRAHRQLEESNESLRAMNDQLSNEVAQRKAMEAQLSLAKADAEKANQAKSAFISQMSHELRTPLNGILGYAQLLKREQLSQQQRDGLDVIEHSGEHLLLLVNDLLDLARIEAGKLELREQRVDLGTLLQHVRDLISVRADKAGLIFDFDAAANLPEQISADARALRQVLLNLLGNAVKFTNPGGRIGLRVDASHLGEDRYQLRFAVADSGIGIPTEQSARIFEPFHRIHDPQRPAEGTGLGLAITQRLVTAMAGSITVDSQPGRGTTFLVEIATRGAAATARTADRQPAITGYRGPRRTVIVADDDNASRTLVTHLLGELGFETRAASNGAAALQLFNERPADLLITDLVMPELDGLALARAVRARGTFSVAIVATSASASGGAGADALGAGCDAFVAKPLRLSDLLSSIGRALSLEWEYTTDDSMAGAGPRAARGEFHLCRVHADELYHLAMLGDIGTLLKRADEMLDPTPAARWFFDKLRALADQYDTGAIRALLTEATAPAT